MTCSDASCGSSRCKSCRGSRPVAPVVISSGAKGDRRAGSLDVKVSLGEASKSAGRSNGEPVSPEIPIVVGSRALVICAKAVSPSRTGSAAAKSTGDAEGDMSTRRTQRKRGTTRGSPRRSRTAKASRITGSAGKSRRACEWGGWGRQARKPGTEQPELSEGPWGRAMSVARTVACDRVRPPASELVAT